MRARFFTRTLVLPLFLAVAACGESDTEVPPEQVKDTVQNDSVSGDAVSGDMDGTDATDGSDATDGTDGTDGTDSTDSTDGVDTDVVDSDIVDTDVVETDIVDSDTVEPGDTVEPEDTTPSCEGPDGCFACEPTEPLEFLNHCTDSKCKAFDNVAKLPLYNGGNLPALP